MEAPVIETRDLTKRYGAVTALSGLSLRIDRGELFGFLGPNGAGKTTTIRLILGLLHPSAGEARLFGRPVSAATVADRGDVGYMPGELTFWPSLSGNETLDFLARLTGRPPAKRRDLIDRLALSARDLARPIRTYSDGMKQKIGIVQALQCGPALALLDEPTKGLDPLMQRAFYDLVLALPPAGTTVFLSSHVLPEVELVCRRVAMLRGGTLVSEGTVDQLRRVMPRRVTLTFETDVDMSDWGEMGDVLVATPRRVELLVAAERVPALVRACAARPIADVVIEAPSFEAAVMERYR